MSDLCEKFGLDYLLPSGSGEWKKSFEQQLELRGRGSFHIKLDMARGILWINIKEKCVLHICRLNGDAVLSAGMLDVVGCAWSVERDDPSIELIGETL